MVVDGYVFKMLQVIVEFTNYWILLNDSLVRMKMSENEIFFQLKEISDYKCIIYVINKIKNLDIKSCKSEVNINI